MTSSETADSPVTCLPVAPFVSETVHTTSMPLRIESTERQRHHMQVMKEFIAKGAPHRRKMSIHVVPSSASDLNAEMLNPENVELLPVPPNLPKPCLVEDIAAFKRQTGLYPLPKPFVETGQAKS